MGTLEALGAQEKKLAIGELEVEGEGPGGVGSRPKSHVSGFLGDGEGAGNPPPSPGPGRRQIFPQKKIRAWTMPINNPRCARRIGKQASAK